MLNPRPYSAGLFPLSISMERMKLVFKNSTLVLLAALVAAGCGGGVEKKPEGEQTPAQSKQTITEKGSDTMVLLAQAWAEKFGAKNANIEVAVSGGGSGTGISALINGTTDIANASRPMNDQERQQIRQKYGTDVVEIPVAKDGVAIYVNAANSVDALSLEQLRGIYSGTVKNWKEVGGADAPIILYGRENSSGTYAFFKEHVLNKSDFAANTQTLPGTAGVVGAIAKDKNGIGYGGEAYGSTDIKMVKIMGANGGPAMEPSEENVRSGAYPLSRELYFYLRQQPTGATKEYVDWVLGTEGQAVVREVGYFPIK